MTQLKSVPMAAPEVNGSRYEIERKLGEGGAGAVYLASDRETGDRVALKKLFRMDARSVLRLKREFRALVDVAHPNLVKLYDMGRADDCWFLTMEYLEGVDLTTHLASADAAAQREALLAAFRELAAAIHALHQARLLHRDLKPSNVMIVKGRVVVLDFGLVRDLSSGSASLTEDGAISGTPAYMAPEQIAGAELNAAADWYGFGAMLYEALCGVLPFEGPMLTLLRNKLERDPVSVHEFATGVPRWLSDLCMALLQRDPTRRPTGEVVLAAFAAGLGQPVLELPPTAADNVIATEGDAQISPLLGRQAQLADLSQALREAEHGQTIVAHVRGLSGSGKSALVERFLDDLDSQNRADTLILRSRCYELEQIPFKALDGVVDALVRHLGSLDDLQVARTLPHDVHALSQLFPVLERLSAVKQLAFGARIDRERVDERQRAEAALRQLIERVAAITPVVIWIDDLQWGDLDSARILRSWLQDVTRSAALLVFSYRSDEIETSSCLTTLLARDSAALSSPCERFVEVPPLDDEVLREVCAQRLGASTAPNSELLTRLVREAQGSPFLASQLTALAQAKIARGDTDLDSLSIAAVVHQTASLVSEDARKLLAVLAVAGRPLAPKLALLAAGVQHHGKAVVHALRGLNLVRTRDIAGERMLEVYHDRVRELVSAALTDQERVAIHAALLHASAFGKHDPAWLMTIALGAGQRSEALDHGLVAAERASASLAFERAAELYRTCIDLAPAEQAAWLWRRLAQACGHSGRGAQAAEAYLEAAKFATQDDNVELRRLAAAHLIRCGEYARAQPLVRQVLEAVGQPIPSSDTAVGAALTWEQARLKLRGLGHSVRAEPAPAVLLAQHDTLDAFGSAMQGYDALRAGLLLTRALRLALDAGEPTRLVRAFCSAALGTAMWGSGEAGVKADALLAHATTLAQSLSERARAEVDSARAISALMLGRMTDVVAPSLSAERGLRTDPHSDPMGDYLRRANIVNVRVTARFELGDVRTACAELRELLREAEVVGNRAPALAAAINEVYMDLAEDCVSTTRLRLEQQAQELPRDCFGIVHAIHMTAVYAAASATREYAWAEAQIAPLWKRWLRSSISSSAQLAFGVYAYRLQMRANQAIARGQRRELSALLQEEVAALHRNPIWRAHGGSRLDALRAWAAGDLRRAAELFRASGERYAALGWVRSVEPDRFAYGTLIGGSEGAALKHQALQRLSEFGVVNPTRYVHFFIPELE